MEVTVPQLGLTMQSAELTQWLVQAGERVEAGQPIAEIATDKIESEIVAPANGILHPVATVGDELPVGAVLATIEEG